MHWRTGPSGNHAQRSNLDIDRPELVGGAWPRFKHLLKWCCGCNLLHMMIGCRYQRQAVTYSVRGFSRFRSVWVGKFRAPRERNGTG